MDTSERRFRIMNYLCENRQTTMAILANLFGVSVRTIKRDIDALGYVIPIIIKQGRHTGGVYIMDGYRWDVLYLNVEETALLMKIKDYAERKEPLVLGDSDLREIEKIIHTHSFSSSKHDEKWRE